MDSIRAEVEAAMPDGKLNMKDLMNSSPHLNSLIDESLRLTTNSISVRTILEDTQLAGKTFRKNNHIMMPYRQLHGKESVFGTNAAIFEPDRFAKNPALRRSSCFKPFGGGSTWCPGRFAARQETAAFIAVVLYRFELSLVNNSDGSLPSFPRLEGAKPCFGMMGTVDNDDLTVRIRHRR
jgi:cytochrome P450